MTIIESNIKTRQVAYFIPCRFDVTYRQVHKDKLTEVLFFTTFGNDLYATKFRESPAFSEKELIQRGAVKLATLEDINSNESVYMHRDGSVYICEIGKNNKNEAKLELIILPK